ncbi:MAG: hypothetical protein H8D67_07575 [Deltaproteobacteria bacterium]|nr:hypothetical protein [Deltaproteobacteria bacterium]
MESEVFSIVGDSLTNPGKSHDERISVEYRQTTDYFNLNFQAINSI